MLWMQLIQFLQSVVEFDAEAEKDLLPDCSRDQDEQPDKNSQLLYLDLSPSFYMWYHHSVFFKCLWILKLWLCKKNIVDFSRWSQTFRLHCILYIFYVCYTACRVTYVYCTSVSSVKSNQLMDQHLVGAEHVCAALTVILLALLRAATHSLMSVASLAWRKYRRETALMTAEIDIDSMNFHNNHIITFNHMLKMKLTLSCPAAWAWLSVSPLRINSPKQNSVFGFCFAVASLTWGEEEERGDERRREEAKEEEGGHRRKQERRQKEKRGETRREERRQNKRR